MTSMCLQTKFILQLKHQTFKSNVFWEKSQKPQYKLSMLSLYLLTD